MKSNRPKLLRPAIRWTALGCVALWLMAVGHCTFECTTDGSHPPSKTASLAVTASSTHHSNQPAHHDNCFCDSLHSVCPIMPNATLERPDFGLAFTPGLVLVAQITAPVLPETIIPRQPPDPELVLTPEVSLGPALHSLAPPVLA